MSLVNYYSSSDDENSGDDDKTEDYVESEIGSSSSAADSSNLDRQAASKPSLFRSLPAPRSSQISIPEEAERTQPSNVHQESSSLRRLGSLNLPLPKKRSKQPIKITAPSLPQMNSDDEDDEPASKKQKPATTNYNLIHHGRRNSLLQFAIGSHVGAIHTATAEHRDPSNRHALASPSSLASRLLDVKHGKEMKEHTLEELVEVSRFAMEKLQKKLELQRKQFSLLSEDSLMGQGSGAPHPVRDSSPASAAPSQQGVIHAVPPGWHLQANPVVNTTLHPGLSSILQTPNFEPPKGMLTSQTFPFALPLGSRGSIANNLPMSISSSAPVNLASVGPQVAVARSEVTAAVAEAPIPKSQTPPKQTLCSPSKEPDSEAHSNCCAACLNRIDVLECKVKKILEHLNSKNLKTDQPSPSSGPFPVSLAYSSQGLVHDTTPDIQSPKRFPSQTLAQLSQDFQTPFLGTHHEHSSPPTMPKPKVVYPRPVGESSSAGIPSQPFISDQYDYQSLMRFKGGSRIRTELEQVAVHNFKNTKDSGNQATTHTGEDSEMFDQSQLQAVIYSAAVFESLPPKIQTVLNVLEKNENGSVTRLEVKQDILISLTPYVKDRSSIARRLADVLFTDDERCICNCSGWRKPAALDPIRMQALTDAVFKLCPAIEGHKKNLWHDCVKAIDAASRHIVRIRKNKGKAPRQGKWLPFGIKSRQDRLNIVAPMVEIDPASDTIDYDNLPARLKSILYVTHRDSFGKAIKVQLTDSYLAPFCYLSKSRLTVACQLADTLFTQKERLGASCFSGQGKRLLDPLRMDALREATFKICPSSIMEQKQLWSTCMKAIDRLSVIPEIIETIPVSPECVSDTDNTLIKTEHVLEDGSSFYGHQFMSSD
ncbi:uncharacterized protein [Asterias amurensis]|uniref:uncharacterized protein isoform X1 n=1 Tax=Asterias amurensis TaxID=7602 RepID=UPI003AB70FEC